MSGGDGTVVVLLVISVNGSNEYLKISLVDEIWYEKKDIPGAVIVVHVPDHVLSPTFAH